jgi:hypothetical protein
MPWSGKSSMYCLTSLTASPCCSVSCQLKRIKNKMADFILFTVKWQEIYYKFPQAISTILFLGLFLLSYSLGYFDYHIKPLRLLNDLTFQSFDCPNLMKLIHVTELDIYIYITS